MGLPILISSVKYKLHLGEQHFLTRVILTIHKIGTRLKPNTIAYNNNYIIFCNKWKHSKQYNKTNKI